MNTKTLVASVLFASSILASGQALAVNQGLTPEQMAKGRETAATMNPPVDFDAMIKEADSLNVECTGDLTRKARIIICGQKIENAKIEADTQRIRKENAELIKQVQQRIKDNK